MDIDSYVLADRFTKCQALMRTIDKATSVLGREFCKLNLELIIASEQGVKIEKKLYDELVSCNKAGELVKIGQRFSVELFEVTEIEETMPNTE